VNMNTNLLAGDGEMLSACIPEREGGREGRREGGKEGEHR